jgi:hypothetical protein
MTTSFVLRISDSGHQEKQELEVRTMSVSHTFGKREEADCSAAQRCAQNDRKGWGEAICGWLVS